MKVAMDIDGVVANIVPLMQKEAAKVGVALTFNRYHPIIGGISDSRLLIDRIVTEILTNQMEQIQPYEDAINFIPEISKYLGYITFITARKEEYLDPTLKWLQDHFHVSFGLVHKPSKEKMHFLIQENFDVFVEDRLRTVNASVTLGLRTYLINRVWNLSRYTHKDVIRVNSLAGFFSREVSRHCDRDVLR